MNKLKQLERNILPLSGEVNQICKPLLTQLGISHFNYRCSYTNGQRCLLTNDPGWLFHYYNQGYGNLKTLEGDKNTIGSKYTIWSVWESNPLFNKIQSEARNYFNLDAGITITIPGRDYVEFFSFGAKREQNVKEEFFLSHLCLLYQFVLYFREQAHLLLKKSELSCLETNIFPDIKNNQLDCITSEFLNRETHLQLVYWDGSSHIVLSQRQSDAFFMSMKGYTHKAIAKVLNVQQRTVTTHLNILKTKLKVKRITYHLTYHMKLVDLHRNVIVDDDPFSLLLKFPSKLDYKSFMEETKINRFFIKRGYLKRDACLTKCEVNVLYYLCHGLKTNEIAEKLGISYRTIYDHINNTKHKMHCFSKLELAKEFLNATSPRLNPVLLNFCNSLN